MLCSVPSKCKTRRELGCDPVRCQPASPERPQRWCISRRGSPLRGPLPSHCHQRAHGDISPGRYRQPKEPLSVQAFCCHCQFHWRFFFISLHSFSPAPPVPPTHPSTAPLPPLIISSYADCIFKLNLQFNNFTTSKFPLCQFLSSWHLCIWLY